VGSLQKQLISSDPKQFLNIFHEFIEQPSYIHFSKLVFGSIPKLSKTQPIQKQEPVGTG